MSTPLATPRGAWIIKTEAYARYNLGPTDLDSIDPISIEPNSHAYGEVYKYNVCDVALLRAKVDELERTLQLGLPQGATVPRRGQTIVRSNAMRDYRLNDNQMNRIRPCTIKPNPHRAGGEMRIYNVTDVEALSNGIASLRTMPAPQAPQQQHASARYGNSYDDDSYDDDVNVFDGMPADDADAFMAQLFNPRR